MTDHELWLPIDDFPGYSVSDYGRVRNDHTGRILAASTTPRGALKVGLVRGTQQTRLVKNLVTDAFLPQRDEIFDTTINLDGDKRNNAVENLAWRPRWFAVMYARQFNENYTHRYTGPIIDVEESVRYDTVNDAAIGNGLLFRDVFMSCLTMEPVFPTRQVFEWLH